MVKATIVTAHGTMEIAEYIADGKVERTDSNIRINQLDNIAPLFASDRPALAPVDGYVPLQAIWDALEA